MSCAKILSLKMQTFPWWSRQNWQVVIILMVRKVTLLTSALTASTFFISLLWNILLQSSCLIPTSPNYSWTFLKMSFSPTYSLSFSSLSLSFKFYYTSFSCFNCPTLSYPKLNFANRIRRWGCSAAQQCEIFSVYLEMHFFALEYKKA